MLNQREILETLNMIDNQHLDIRTITMGISLRNCGHPDAKIAATKMYDKITKYAENLVMVANLEDNTEQIFSQNYACPDCGIGFEELSPRMFSFNNPFGACPDCTGIGYLMKMDEELIIPDKTKTLYDGVKAFGSSTLKKGDTMARMYFESIGRHYGVDILKKPIKKLPREFLEKILYGTGSDVIDFRYESSADNT